MFFFFFFFQKPIPPYLLTGKEPFSSINNTEGLTLVTAYFNLGTFKKGPIIKFSTETYYEWMKNYGYINNTVILYTDLPDLGLQFKAVRSKFPKNMTLVFIVQQTDFWAFQIQPNIYKIFKQDGYPQYYPNTVFPGYSSAMHVKYDVIDKAIREGLVKTKHLAWIDIGYFRGEQEGIFTLELPEDFKDDHIAYSQINRFRKEATPWAMVFDNMVFLAGGIFMGRPEYLLLLVEDYKQAVHDMMQMKIMSTDQQVLYFMYSHRTSFNVRVPIQRYYSVNRQLWFFLGELSKENSLKKIRFKKSLTDHMLYTYISGV